MKALTSKTTDFSVMIKIDELWCGTIAQTTKPLEKEMGFRFQRSGNQYHQYFLYLFCFLHGPIVF